MEAERTLSSGELHRAVLARQFLLERSAADLPTTLDRMATLQAQYAPSMYVGLWSRLEGFTRSQLDQALESRAVVQATLMRVTIHLSSAGDYWPLTVAVREARRRNYLRAWRRDEAEVRSAAGRVEAALQDGPKWRKELEQIAGKDLWYGVGLWLDMVRVPPSGTWERRRADLYGLAEQWLGPPPADLTVDQSTQQLVVRYLNGFGPAELRDIANWGGVAVSPVADAVKKLDLRCFRTEEGRLLYDLPDAVVPAADAPAPVRFLPTWDATLLVHARRTGILPEEYRDRIFHVRNPHSSPTFLVDGRVAGTWRYVDGSIQLDPFHPLDATTQRELQDEADRLVELHA